MEDVRSAYPSLVDVTPDALSHFKRELFPGPRVMGLLVVSCCDL